MKDSPISYITYFFYQANVDRCQDFKFQYKMAERDDIPNIISNQYLNQHTGQDDDINYSTHKPGPGPTMKFNIFVNIEARD